MKWTTQPSLELAEALGEHSFFVGPIVPSSEFGGIERLGQQAGLHAQSSDLAAQP
jgi:hypothetical protein